MFLALLLIAQVAQPPAPVPSAPAAPPARVSTPRAPGETLVVVDDRDIKDQAPPAFLARVLAELAKRKGFVPERLSSARKGLDARSDRDLSSCGDDAGCLATAGRELGAKLIVTVRLTKREGAFLVAITRISALRPQLSDDAGTLAGTELDALAAVPDAIGELFPEVELKAP